MSVAIVSTYFDLSDTQRAQFAALEGVYQKWNQRINLVSRKDIGKLYLRHALHSLSIAKIISFRPETRVLDVGTGGGFPGVPLAIFFPKVRFHLVDSIGKKTDVVRQIAIKLNLDNVKTTTCRVEALQRQYDFAVSRAVAPLETIYRWVADKIDPVSRHSIKNGMLCLKGGELKNELYRCGTPYRLYPLYEHFSEGFFKEKKVVHIPVLRRP